MGQIPARELVTTGPAVAPSALRAAANTEVVGYLPHGAVLRCRDLGAGRIVPIDAGGSAVADAVTSVLADPALRQGAKRMATAIAGYGGSADAVAELERLVSGQGF